MTSAAPYDATAAAYNDSAYSQPLQDSQHLEEGDTVRCGDNPEDCRVIGSWSDWLWLHSLHPGKSRAVHGPRRRLQTREARRTVQLAVPVRPLRVKTRGATLAALRTLRGGFSFYGGS